MFLANSDVRKADNPFTRKDTTRPVYLMAFYKSCLLSYSNLNDKESRCWRVKACYELLFYFISRILLSIKDSGSELLWQQI